MARRPGIVGEHLNDAKLKSIAKKISATYGRLPTIEQLDGRPIPSRDTVEDLLNDLFVVLYPGYYGGRDVSAEEAGSQMAAKLVKVRRVLAEEIARSHRHTCAGEHKVCDRCMGRGGRKSEAFLERIPHIRKKLVHDVEAAYDEILSKVSVLWRLLFAERTLHLVA